VPTSLAPRNVGETVALSNYGFILVGTEFSSVHENESFTARVIGVAERDQVIAAATRLVEDGVQMIELCGGFDQTWVDRDSDATSNAVPVGVVAFAAQHNSALAQILS
jgi:hypothetical protein